MNSSDSYLSKMALSTPWRITFVTNPSLCNLHCDMCRVHSRFAAKGRQNEPVLDFAIIERTIRELVPLGLREVIPSTMGEPFLYPNFLRFIELCAQTKVFLNITTNGTFPNGGVEFWTPLILPVVSDIKFSLLSLNHARNNQLLGGIDSQTQRQNILAYLEQRKRYMEQGKTCGTVSLQVTRMQTNAKEIDAIQAWASEVGIDRVKVNDIRIHFSAMQHEAMQTDLSRHDGECPFLGKEVWILADGRVAPCPHPAAWDGALGMLGNIGDKECLPAQTLAEVWNAEPFRRVVCNGMKNLLCQTCGFRQDRISPQEPHTSDIG